MIQMKGRVVANGKIYDKFGVLILSACIRAHKSA